MKAAKTAPECPDCRRMAERLEGEREAAREARERHAEDVAALEATGAERRLEEELKSRKLTIEALRRELADAKGERRYPNKTLEPGQQARIAMSKGQAWSGWKRQ